MLSRLTDRYRARQRALDAFFSAMPLRSRWRLAGAVFCCFAPVGLLGSLPSLGRPPWTDVAIVTLYSGGIAVMYGASAVAKRRKWLLPVAIAVNFAATFALRSWLRTGPPPETLGAADVIALRAHLTLVMFGVISCMVLAYVLFVQVLQSEGRRYAHVQTEIRLASEIHAALVPALAGRAHGLEWRGLSRPSGEVGGDLVDVQDDGQIWSACVADVSGHGVTAGLLMAMFKTAIRCAAPGTARIGGMLTDINRTLGPLKQPNMFVTAAILRRRDPATFEYALAGHPPLLHVRARTHEASWIGESQLAVGMIDDAQFRSDVLTVEPGDLLIVVTDGLVEVFDRDDRELGLNGLRSAVASLPVTAPLAEFEARIFDAVRRHGPQLDDQTVLIVRT